MLHTCDSCQRFIREATCPFCGAAQEKQSATGGKAKLNVSRSALLVGGAIAVAGCADQHAVVVADMGTSDSGSDSNVAMADAAPDLGPDLSVIPAYGISPPDMGADMVSMADAYGIAPDMSEDLSIAPLYGIPPPDLGVDDAGGNTEDLSVAPAYGIPPP